MASRTQNSIRNVFAAWGGQALLAVSQFVVRAVFVACLAQEYVGLETLFASVLTVLRHCGPWSGQRHRVRAV